jgi:hypothetical protein
VQDENGVSGATAFSSSSVGSRFSANWCSLKPPTTRTHCGGGVQRDLALEHAHRIGEALHAVPAQLHVEVESAADDVGMVVAQAGQHLPALEPDELRAGPARGTTSASLPTRRKRPSLIATALATGFAAVQRREHAVMEDEVGNS